MAQKQYIKHLFENEELSLREIARRMELSFQTVQKYAYMEDWSDHHLPDVNPNNYPILKDVIPIIDRWLEDDIRQPRKQRHTMTRIHERLQTEHDFKGSYSTVKKYVRKKKYIMQQGKEGFLPLTQPMAHAQIDFGTFKYIDAYGINQVAYALTITFPYSNKGYTQVFKAQNQECLLEGMQRIFGYIGGSPIRIKADNMSTAVAKILEGGKRELAEGFNRFMLHYRFLADFCNPASGNEKGAVENKVGYTRRKFFVPIPTIADFNAFNQSLLQRCDDDGDRPHYKKKRSINELFREEQPHLLVLPPLEYQIFRHETVRVNNYGYIAVDKNKYGVSPELIDQRVQAKIFYDKIEIYYEHALLKAYSRSYQRGEEVNDWKLYVALLCKKPGAVEHTRFFEQMPSLWQGHLKSLEGAQRKSALMLLMEIVKDDNTVLCDNVIAMAQGCGKTDSETLRQCYYNLAKKPYRPDPLVLDIAVPELNYNPDLSAYDSLTGGESFA